MSQNIGSELLSFVLRSKNRRIILRLLSKERLVPSQIIIKTGMYQDHASRTLKYLRDNKLIICENPKDLNYKVYKITLLGSKISKDVEKILNK